MGTALVILFWGLVALILAGLLADYLFPFAIRVHDRRKRRKR